MPFLVSITSLDSLPLKFKKSFQDFPFKTFHAVIYFQGPSILGTEIKAFSTIFQALYELCIA